MNRSRNLWFCGALTLGIVASVAWPCGAPPPMHPPPPPPDPPIVCCVMIDWFPDPNDPDFECVIIRYFRQDGRPLYNSNPMPLLPTQKCMCAVPPLSNAAIFQGAVVTGFSFGSLDPPWQGLPPDVPGYGPFQVDDDPSLIAQTSQFFQAYNSQTAGTTTAPDSGPFQLFSFSGPGTIPPGAVFDIYQKIRVPRGFDPRKFCIPGQMWMIGLFLVDNGIVFAEPIQPGLPPVNSMQFFFNPGNSAFYKFKWYPLIVPPPCPPLPPFCSGDADGNGIRNFSDIITVLANFGDVCP